MEEKNGVLAKNEKQANIAVAKGMEQVNSNTQSNCNAIEHITAASQKNSAGVQEIESMVERIKEIAARAVESVEL